VNPFFVVEAFEQAVADFAGARYGVAVNSGTSALFLSLKYVRTQGLYPGGPVTLPARTFISVPMMCLHAGAAVQFEDKPWKGVYQLKPYPIWDGALRFRRGMYEGGLHCLSFHGRKILAIGEGGMVLTDDEQAAKWLKRARHCGRQAPDFKVEDVTELGWLCYMQPDRAARGLMAMQWAKDNAPDQEVEYADLRKVKVFHADEQERLLERM